MIKWIRAQPDGPDMNIVETIESNTRRYVDVFSEAVDAVMPKESQDIT